MFRAWSNLPKHARVCPKYEELDVKILVTGAAGFIGANLSKMLIDQGHAVVGIDNFNDYYDVSLKRDRVSVLLDSPEFEMVEAAIETEGLLIDLFAAHQFDAVVHLAAQAGVRYSIEAPRTYLASNICGTFELLEAARKTPPKHMLLASTSSAYGANSEMPYCETQKADHQMSFYAATKKATESMAHSYAHLYGLPITMFRFFTVYGPWGRPDMAPFLFTDAILKDRPIKVFNHGDMKRDFTYVDDLNRALSLLITAGDKTQSLGSFDTLSPVAPFRVVNIGNNDPVQLLDFIQAIETATGKTAAKNFMDMQPGDVPATWADTTLLQALTGYKPQTNIQEGVNAFVEWYQSYYEHKTSQ